MVSKLKAPKDKHLDVLIKCTSNLQSTSLKQQFKDNEDFIIDAGDDFALKIGLNKLYTIKPANMINGVITKDNMNYLYTGKLSKKGQPGRTYYDNWRSIAAFGQCPLCGVRTVSTLDHYLPKSDFPIFSILPINLIPSCKDCNTDKLTTTATTHAEETIHPYFDDIEDDHYLFAHLQETTPVTFSFKVNAPIHWDYDLRKRLKAHFRVFQLNKLYVTLAAQELTNIRFRLKNTFSTSGANGVKSYLWEGYETRMNGNKNSWQTAMY